ncbi:S9 family peptidase [Alteriqipengyuania lutimaris]|uniref:S9 family peptidase n=1 Tax=Alteriqipengyuania lutimaris TaxID=1538146 RepID=A0A395LPC0_9SPHN|nr:S9 family peptidase [Alteriqipengyuania lutimaris]
MTASCAGSLARPGRTAASGCWPNATPPVASRVDDWIEQLGRRRNDPYSWMKFIPDEGVRSLDNLPPRLANHLEQEADYARAMLGPLEARREAFVSAMLARSGTTDAAPPLMREEWLYYSYVPQGATRPVHVRRKPEGPEQILVDEAVRAEGRSYYRATEFQPSPDHRYFAWAEDLVGNDRHRICVLDTQDGEVRVLVPGDAYGYGGLTFAPGSDSLFWIWRDARNRPTRLYRSALGGGEGALVYEERDPAIFMQVRRTAAGGFVALELAGPDTSETRLIARGAESAPPRVVREREEGIIYSVHEWNGQLLMLTTMDEAFDGKLVRLDSRTLKAGPTLVPHRPGRPIVSLLPFEDGLVRLERADGLHRLVLMKPDGTERDIAFNAPAFALTLPPGQDYSVSSVRVGFETPARPMSWYDVDLVSGERTLVGETELRNYDPGAYRVERTEARAPDGTMVPVTLLSRRDHPRHASSPLLLYGYGAYGVSSEPVFSLPATVLVDAGWVYAIAHVRGGGEEGRQWFLDGRRFQKRNSMTDFIACARHLVAQKRCAPEKVTAYGLSAGGLLVAGAMNIAPELWAGVIAKVPFVDMLNTMSDADHPLVPLFRPDWGDPLADPQAYDYIASISPYENVKPASYPALLCTAGLKDDRVAYWEPAKLVAEVRHRALPGEPAILLVDPDAGHQGSADLREEYSEMALFWAFAEQSVSDCASRNRT